MSIQDLANEVLKSMTQKTRDSGETFRCLVEDAPDWMSDLMHESHSSSMPCDIIFEFIHDALHALSENDSEDDARDSIEGDTYNRELLAWVSSNLNRAEYVNRAVSEGLVDVSSDFSLFDTLRMGQYLEKTEVFDAVLAQLQNRLDEVEAA